MRNSTGTQWNGFSVVMLDRYKNVPAYSIGLFLMPDMFLLILYYVILCD